MASYLLHKNTNLKHSVNKNKYQINPFPLTPENKCWAFTNILINRQNLPLMQFMPVIDLFEAFHL